VRSAASSKVRHPPLPMAAPSPSLYSIGAL
jgi:hypothetical protein